MAFETASQVHSQCPDNQTLSGNSFNKTLILGGVRSGKSRLAESLANETGFGVSYIATAKAEDAEMCERIATHRARRPPNWKLIEEPYKLASTLVEHAAPERCLLVECLTLWVTNMLTTEDDRVFEYERAGFLSALSAVPGQIILVSNETNMGVVPMGELSRRFCDNIGALHQELAQICDRVILTVAGLPHVLKGKPW